MRFSLRFRATRERRIKIEEEIAAGSEPQGRFYALLIISAMIASFGLVADSTAVIIGAMLVSPLMIPIFGIALGVLRGNGKLIWRAASAEAAGVVLAVGGAFLFGIADITAETATSEMLARMHPNLIDLLVAVFAGFAGAYALVDERISPALPGVAIATAIVPPLATAGLCLAMGAFAGAAGAMLLFFANLVAILAVALITFSVAGFAPELKHATRSQIANRFVPTLAAFVVIAGVLTHSLLRIVKDQTIHQTIEAVVVETLTKSHAISLDGIMHQQNDGRVQILVTIRAPQAVTANQVWSVQKTMSDRLQMPADLVVRTILARDVAPTGSNLIVTSPNYDGLFLSANISKVGAKTRLAEQIVREFCQEDAGFKLLRINYGPGVKGRPLVLASVETLRGFSVNQIKHMEKALQTRLAEPELFLIIRSSKAQLACRDGAIDIHWTNLSRATDDELREVPNLKKIISDEIRKMKNLFASTVLVNKKANGVWAILAQVSGPVSVTPSEVEVLHSRIAQKMTDKRIELNLWHRGDFIITPNGYAAFDDFTNPVLEELRKRLPDMFQKIASR